MCEAGESHHDNAGGSRKLSAVAAGHTMQVKERHYEKVGGNFRVMGEVDYIGSGYCFQIAIS